MCGTNPQLHKMTEDDKQFILDLHNKHRNEIASGSVSRYSSAANMKEVVRFLIIRQPDSQIYISIIQPDLE